MSLDLVLVLLLLAVAVAMFAANRPRMDAVALLMLVALPLTGVIEVEEALAGFADPTVILIAALFVIGESLVRTGVARRIGDWLLARAGDSENRLIVLLMTSVAALGSVMSSTAVVAIFIPVVQRIARRTAIPAGRLMMPLSVAGLLSGMMTLVATPPNLVVAGEMIRQGHDGFHFFAFAPFGLVLLILGVGYMLVARRWLGNARAAAASPHRPSLGGWIEEYGLAGREHRLQVEDGSNLAGRALAELDLRGSAGINIVAIERRGGVGRRLLRPTAATELRAGDVLFIDAFAPLADIDAVARRFSLRRLPLSGQYFSDRAAEIGMAEVLVPPTSGLIGRTVVESQFRSRYDLAVIGLRRGNEPMRESVLAARLRAGDTLLLVGPWRAIRRLRPDWRELVVFGLPTDLDDAPANAARAPLALGILLLVVALMAGGVLPNVIAALIGCLLLGLARCIDFDAAYRSIHWQSLVLIVGMMPFAVALQKTGGVGLAAAALLEVLGGAGIHAVLAGLFAITAVLGLFISNTATAVLMAPVALAVARDLGASPHPFAMTVALAASAAFMTPVSSPVNVLVAGPGNYRFADFLRVGVPFALAAMVVCVALAPILLPP